MIAIHSDFKLNGQAYDNNGIEILSENYINSNEDYLRSVGDFLKQWLDTTDSILLKTSGSTGKPKLIYVNKEHMINSALATAKYFGLKSKDKALCCLPTDFISGKMMLVRALIIGLDLDLILPKKKIQIPENKYYDFVAMTPMQAGESLSILPQIKLLLLGGSAVPTDLEEKLQYFSTKVYATYGMTETVSHIAVRSINSEEKNKVYKALSNVTFEKDDRDCLVIHCPKVSDLPIITNDRVELLSKTSFFWKGRYDNVINSGGIKIFPEEVEQKISKLLIQNFFVWYESHSVLGQQIILFIEADIKDKECEILQKIRQNTSLKSYEIPKKIYFMNHFLYTETQKIRRKETVLKYQQDYYKSL